MPEAPRTRPEYASVLHSLSAHIVARPRAVFTALASELDPGPDAGSFFTADPAAGLIIAQGGWYRAEYRIVPDEHGCRLEHTVLNVSERGRPPGRFSGRKVVESAPADFQRIVRRLKAELE